MRLTTEIDAWKNAFEKQCEKKLTHFTFDDQDAGVATQREVAAIDGGSVMVKLTKDGYNPAVKDRNSDLADSLASWEEKMTKARDTLAKGNLR